MSAQPAPLPDEGARTGRFRRSWLYRPEPSDDAGVRLFCFPYAGGSAQAFHTWPDVLGPGIDVVALALPGRGNRLREPAIGEMPALVEAIVPELEPLLDRPYALFGHSMGGMLAFEIARALRRLGAPPPERLFVSAVRAPHLPARVHSHDLPESDFVERLRRLDGTPEQVLSDERMLRVFLPPLRADLRAIETYAYAPEPPLDVPVVGFGGRADPEVGEDEMRGWDRHTTGPFTLRMFDGGHFFLSELRDDLLRLVGFELEVVPAL